MEIMPPIICDLKNDKSWFNWTWWVRDSRLCDSWQRSLQRSEISKYIPLEKSVDIK